MSCDIRCLTSVVRSLAALLCCWLATGCSTDERIFLKACHDGNVQAAELLAKKVGSDCTGRSGVTGLMLAARSGHLAVVRFLLSQGARPETRDDDGRIALDYALAGGCSSTVKELLDALLRGNNTTAKEQALVSLSITGSVAMVEAALASGVDPNSRRKGGWTALMYAVRRGDSQVCESLLRAGADPDIGDEGPERAFPIIVAAVMGHDDIVELLMKNKVDVSVRDYEGASALLRAIRAERLGTVKRLLELGYDPNESCKGWPVLLMALEMREFESARMLLEAGARRDIDLGCARVPLSAFLEKAGITGFVIPTNGVRSVE